MAKSSMIGSLRIALGMDSAQFQAGVANAGKSLEALSRKAAAFGAALGAAVTGAAAALSVAVKKTIDEADEMSKAAQKFGVGVEELSRLKHAADLSGVSLGGLGTGLRRLSQAMSQTAAGAKNEAAKAFEQLGISVTTAEGGLKSSTEIMAEIAGKFASMRDGADKTALALAIFGRSGADLIPMLNGGADGLREMMKEADQLGIVLRAETGQAAEAFNDNLSRIGKAWDGLVLQLTEVLLPSLELLSERFIQLVKDGDAVKQIGEGLITVLRFVANEVGQLTIVGARLRAEFAGISEAMGRLMRGDFSGAWAAFNEGQRKSAEMAEELRKSIEEIFSGAAISQGGIQRRISRAFEDAGDDAGNGFRRGLKRATEGMKEIQAMLAEGAQIAMSVMTPLERYRDTIANLNILLDQGAISQETYNRAVLQAQDAFAKAEAAGKQTESVFQQIGQTMAQGFASAFTSIIDGSQKAGDAVVGLLRQLANLLLNRAFQMLFNMMFPGSGGFSVGGFVPTPGVGMYAKGTDSAKRGLAIVGEQGPELVRFRGGEQVIPNHELDGLGGGGNVMNVNVHVSGARGNAEIQEMVERGVRSGLSQYDQTLPTRVQKILIDPRAR